MSRPRSRTRKASPGPAAPHLRREAARGRPHPRRLQHPEGVHAPPRPPPPRRGQEEEEEDLHQAQEDQAQEEEGQASGPAVLQGGRLGEGAEAQEGVPQRRVRRRDVHGQPLRSPLLRQVRAHLCLSEGRGRVKVGSLTSLVWLVRFWCTTF
ncbi:ubiquitin-40S ribosomal protein S27a [Iris pallida]|uniref:Ubiquitin-40S ribosomal protein S27a n=1 Tax=Iris pallida TaxID=29817 RepID=A0AAX6I2F4_IRIPA|nr:ubiquitin-40S ribosomal protein S27a [Iris pallida]